MSFLTSNNIYDYTDILNASFTAWRYMAEETGIDATSLINNNYPAGFYTTNDLTLTNPKYKGKSYLTICKKSSKMGLIYPILHFGTHKHGGIKYNFNGYHWLWETFENKKQLRPFFDNVKAKKYIAKKNSTSNNINKNFERLSNLFRSLSFVELNNLYLIQKCPWLTSTTLKRVQLKEGKDNWGRFIIAPMQDINNNIKGFQRIYENTIINRTSNKDFCVKYSGAKKGSFIYISGDESLGYVAVCEGLSTALSFADFEPAPIYVALDAGNLPSVCQSIKLPIRLYCDNDCWSDTNTGKIVGLKIKENQKNIHILLPPTQLKIKTSDYNDLRHKLTEQSFEQLIIEQQIDTNISLLAS